MQVQGLRTWGSTREGALLVSHATRTASCPRESRKRQTARGLKAAFAWPSGEGTIPFPQASAWGSGGLQGNAQHEVLAEEEWGVGAEVSLPDFEILSYFNCHSCQTWISAQPTHLQSPLGPQAPVLTWQRHGPQEKRASIAIAEHLGL